MEDEFKAVKAIMDVLVRSWTALAPDTQSWLKSRMAKLPDGQVVQDDVDRERV